jgi:hypothetical protein
MRRAALVALALAACHSERKTTRVDLTAPPPPPPPAHASVAPPAPPGPLFPEDPSLAAAAVPDAAFVQETWTGAADWQQHCHEWGFPPAREAAVREATNAALASRGVHLPDKPRAKGIVVALGAYAPGVVSHGKLIKLVVCSEGVAPRSGHDAFTARLMTDRGAPNAPAFAALGPPDVAWERVHRTGEVEYGFRWPHPDAAAATRAIDAVADLHDGHFDAKLRGPDLWWTGLRAP